MVYTFIKGRHFLRIFFVKVCVKDFNKRFIIKNFISSVPDGMDIQEKLNEGAAKVVPLGMDEFMTSEGNSSMMISRQTRIMAGSEIKTGADVSDFPDLLDSGNSLASLNPTYSFDDQSTNDPSLDRFLKSTSLKTESDGGLVFTNLNEMNNVYPEVDESNLNPPVVAKKSVVQLTDVKSEVEFQVKNEHTATLEQTECVYVKSEVKEEPAADSKLNSQQFQTTLTFYNAAENSGGRLQSVGSAAAAVPSSLPAPAAAGIIPSHLPTPNFIAAVKPVEKQETIVDLTSDSEDNDPRPLSALGQPPKSATPPTKIVPILSPPRDGTEKDPTKETYTHLKSDGTRIDVPTIITNGYDFENMRCLLCDKPPFKNEKTLINHLLNHFGVTPKMAKCPVCGLSLQKKSFARHARLHGDFIPETCPYCKKEFREKRSLEKHIKAIHEAERPLVCDRCPERFRNQVELRAHITRHEKDHPFSCEICSMTFQKQDALIVHIRSHTGERPFACSMCDKTFSNEKSLKTHVLRHEGNLPHKCDSCDMTFPSRAHLEKHASTHKSKTQVTVAKINTFLESFGASLGEFGLDDGVGYDSSDQISLHPATESGEIEDQSVRLQMETSTTSTSSSYPSFVDANEEEDDGVILASMSMPNLVNGITEEEAELLAKKELSVEIPITVNGVYQCKLCNLLIGNRRSYLIHLRRHARMLNFKCEYCPKTFSDRGKLTRHLNTHSRDGTNVQQGAGICIQYSAGTNTTSVPVSAASGGHPDSSLSCTMCGKFFADKTSLQEHTKMHLIEDAKAKFRKDKKVNLFLLFNIFNRVIKHASICYIFYIVHYVCNVIREM